MAEPARLIKKYPNRRLYDTRTSTYITLADVKKLVLQGEEFQVVDAKTSEDLTRSILLQVILEEETAGAPMFSSDVLTQFIRSYGNAMQGMLGPYLERNMQLFSEIQKRMQEQLQNQTKNMFSGFPFAGFPGTPGFGAQPGGAQKPDDDKAPGDEKKS